MLQSTHRSRPLHASTWITGLFASAVLWGASACSSEEAPPAPPAGAATQAQQKSDAAAKTAAADAQARKDAESGAAVAKQAAETASATIAAKEAAAATPVAPSATTAAADPHAGHDHPPGEHPGQESKAAATAPADPHAGHDHAPGEHPGHENKNMEGITAETDPNSKAKLTYEFGTDAHNFGKVMQGDVLTHRFQVMSSGEEDLVIKQAKPTCGCTVAEISVQQADGTMVPYSFGTPIPTGRKVEIAATLSTANKRGHAGSSINIFSNDPRGQSQMRLDADVEPFFQVNPTSLNFNQLSVKDTRTDKLSISTTKGQRVILTANTDNLPKGLKIEVNALDADAEGKATRYEVVATAGPGLNEGTLAYSLPLKSDIAVPGAVKQPNGAIATYDVTATIMGRVSGMIDFSPNFISLGLIRPGQVLSRTVRIKSHDPEFELKEPKVVVEGGTPTDLDFSKYFSSVIRPVAGENAIDVELRLDGMPESLNGSFRGTMVIKIGHPEKPEISLPITGVCRGGVANQAPASQETPK